MFAAVCRASYRGLRSLFGSLIAAAGLWLEIQRQLNDFGSLDGLTTLMRLRELEILEKVAASSKLNIPVPVIAWNCSD